MRQLQAWEVLHSEYLLKKRWLSVRQDRVRTGAGFTIEEFHVLEVPSWACICCFSQTGELVLTRQYRHGVSKVTLELPAGVIEADETPIQGAQRELFEETGYTSEDWAPLMILTPEPARHTHLAHCFIALNAVASHQQCLDEAEDLLVETVPASQALSLIEEGRLTHAVHVAALLLAQQRGLIPTG
jgi:8-oxo-dGTP pyrophosphatase MutT (NUDIX family)